MNTLLCLLSDQRMQNAIPLFQRGFHFDCVTLIGSAVAGKLNPSYEKIAKQMQSALAEKVRIDVWPEAADPMDLAAVQALCERAVATTGEPHNVTVNFTGGTKPMSVGAFLAAQKHQLTALYVDTGRGLIYRYRDGGMETIPFDLEPISVGMILNIHGQSLNEGWTQSKQPAPEDISAARLIYQERSEILPWIIALIDTWRKSAEKDVDRSLDRAVLMRHPELYRHWEETGRLHTLGERVCLDPPGLRFLDGGWLEQYTTTALQESGCFTEVLGNLQLEKVENELDACCTYGGKLAVIECKSGDLRKGKGQASLNRLRAIKNDLGGFFTRACLVTDLRKEQIGKQFLDRASVYGVNVFGLDELGTIDQAVFEILAR